MKRRDNIESSSHCCPTKVTFLQEKQNARQPLKPDQSNMTSSAQNNEVTPKSTIFPVKNTDPSPKTADASSNSEDKTGHILGNVEEGKIPVNDNVINENKVQKTIKKKRNN